MWIKRLIDFMAGYVTVVAEGKFLERFLNICMRRNIFLSDVKHRGEERLEVRLGRKDFKRLRPVARKTKTRVRILGRHGLPFFLHKYKKRKLAVIGLVLFFGMLWFLSGHIMGIDITGNERIDTKALKEGLREAGVFYGANASRIDRKSVQNKMMTDFDDIAWIGINIKGSRAYIEVKERLDTDLGESKEVPCNIIAARDGIVRILDIKEGQSVVKTNTMVEKGDLLVSGAVNSSVDGIRFVHSFGSVFAETTYEKRRVYSLEYTEKLYTGKTKTKTSVEILGINLNLYLKEKSSFAKSDASSKRTEYPMLWGYLPSVYLNQKIHSEYTEVKKSRTVSDIAELGRKELLEELKKEMGETAEIKDVSVTFSEVSQNKVEIVVKALCFEDIAHQSPIDKIENIQYDKVEEK